MRSIELWQPLSSREIGTPEIALVAGLPGALQPVLRNWIYYASSKPWDAVDRIMLRMGINYRPSSTRGTAGQAGDWNAPILDARISFLAYRSPTSKLLDIVDALLSLIPQHPPAPTQPDPLRTIIRKMTRDHRRVLQRHLDDARSVYRISDDGRCLVRRVNARANAAFEETIATSQARQDAGSADQHLSAAWTSLHALHPDASYAYSEAIKAVESAAHAVVQPNHARATLGTMLGELRQSQGKFSLVIPGPSGSGDIMPLIEMMALLWQGQTARHGSKMPTRPETLPEAQMAVHLAVTLVQWFSSGAVRRTP